jgi:hypothetical protein
LPLTADLARVLRTARKQAAHDRLAYGFAYHDAGYVVADRLGRPLHPDTITSRWGRAVADAGVSPQPTPNHIAGIGVDLRKQWSRRGDSNPQPSDYKSDALPIAPHRRRVRRPS